MSVTHDFVFCDMFPPSSWGPAMVLCSQPNLLSWGEGTLSKTPVKTEQEWDKLNTGPSRDTDRGGTAQSCLAASRCSGLWG